MKIYNQFLELKQLIRSKETLMESHDRENEKQIKLTLKALRATEDTLTKEQEKCKILQRNVRTKQN